MCVSKQNCAKKLHSSVFIIFIMTKMKLNSPLFGRSLIVNRLHVTSVLGTDLKNML